MIYYITSTVSAIINTVILLAVTYVGYKTYTVINPWLSKLSPILAFFSSDESLNKRVEEQTAAMEELNTDAIAAIQCTHQTINEIETFLEQRTSNAQIISPLVQDIRTANNQNKQMIADISEKQKEIRQEDAKLIARSQALTASFNSAQIEAEAALQALCELGIDVNELEGSPITLEGTPIT